MRFCDRWRAWSGVAIGLALGLAGWTVAADPGEWNLEGPLPFRDMTAPSILFLDLPPSEVDSDRRPGWDLGVVLSHSNNFVFSANVDEYLQARDDPQRPLDSSDVAELLRSDEDLFYFDAAVSILRIDASYRLDDKWSVGIALPIYSFNGGFLDSTIESFHESFGLSSEGRDLVATNQSQVIQRFGESSFVLLDGTGKRYGLADPVFSVRRDQDFGRGFQATGEAAIKVPIGEENDFYSTGHADFGMQAHLRYLRGRQSFNVGMSHIWNGRVRFVPGFRPADVTTLHFAYEFAWSPRTAILLQGTNSDTVFDRATNTRISERKNVLSLGFRHRRGDTAYFFAVSENLAEFSNSADIAFHFGVTTRRDR